VPPKPSLSCSPPSALGAKESLLPLNWTTLFIASLFTLLCPPWLARG
jgi:hypothetical protein